MDAIILPSHNSFILYGYLENEYECDDHQKSGARIAVVRCRHGRRLRAGSAGMPFLRPRLAGKPGAGDRDRHLIRTLFQLDRRFDAGIHTGAKLLLEIAVALLGVSVSAAAILDRG